MLHILVVMDRELRDALVSRLSLRKQREEERVIFYQKNEWILAFSEDTSIEALVSLVISEYSNERIYLILAGHSIDTEHEIGDVILPNVFLRYNQEIADVEITNENRDDFLGEPRFLEIFDEQRDYYVENFGLSIGGIVVSSVPVHNESLYEKLMTAYEADAYLEHDLREIIPKKIDENVPDIVFLIGIITGKIPKNIRENTADFLSENIITTLNLLESEDAI